MRALRERLVAQVIRVYTPCILLAEPSLCKRSGTYLPKYLRIPNALRLNG